MDKKLLFSVTKDQIEFVYTKGTGAGGQKRNKTSSAVHCTHRPSGAYGYSESSRSQHDNKKEAFLKMTETKEFKDWVSVESMKKTGELAEIEHWVNEQLKHVVVEVQQNGKWIPYKETVDTQSQT